MIHLNLFFFLLFFFLNLNLEFSIFPFSDSYMLLCIWVNAKDAWENRWVKSDWKKDENVAGEWNYTAGQWNGDPNDKGKLNYYVGKPCIVPSSVCFLLKN